MHVVMSCQQVNVLHQLQRLAHSGHNYLRHGGSGINKYTEKKENHYGSSRYTGGPGGGGGVGGGARITANADLRDNGFGASKGKIIR